MLHGMRGYRNSAPSALQLQRLNLSFVISMLEKQATTPCSNEKPLMRDYSRVEQQRSQTPCTCSTLSGRTTHIATLLHPGSSARQMTCLGLNINHKPSGVMRLRAWKPRRAPGRQSPETSPCANLTGMLQLAADGSVRLPH